MKKLILICGILTVCFSCSNSSTNSDVNDTTVYEEIKIIDYSADTSKKTLCDRIKEDVAAKRHTVIMFTATWCGPCKAFKKTLRDKLMQKTFANTTLIMVDIDDDNAGEGIGLQNGVTAVPTFLKVNEKCDVLKKITSAAWEEDDAESIAPVMKEFIEK
ncbi:MAG: thioredoxin family protein [Bacteroidia bacterium]|nr:thioredoxin family protein [Bacteroidia bacterium]